MYFPDQMDAERASPSMRREWIEMERTRNFAPRT